MIATVTTIGGSNVEHRLKAEPGGEQVRWLFFGLVTDVFVDAHQA